jgi:hypothetical protein
MLKKKFEKMKEYIKPNLKIVEIKTESLLDIASVQGADDITRKGTFAGGNADSRDGGYWDDED